MRLTCPTCPAQYEVPDEVIPEDGRDVQCSACGDTWFQLHPSHPNYNRAFDPDTPEAEFDLEDDVAEAAYEALEEPSPEAEVARASECADPHEDAGSDMDAGDMPAETPAMSRPTRRDLSEDVTSVLREEADREAKAREADMRGGLEMQPDLGISEVSDVERRSQQAKTRMARLRGFDEARDAPVSDLVQSPDPNSDTSEPPQEIDLGTRADMLPDVEDIDQKIEEQSAGDSDAAAARDGTRVATEKEGTSGFRRGMRVSVSVAAVAAVIYVFAPQLSGTLPALSAPLTEYTQLVDQGRAALQNLIRP